MITKSAIDNLSFALLDDERIVTTQEKGLLAELLRHANHQTNTSPDGLAEAITRIAGEVIAERACGILGPKIIERIADRRAETGGFPRITGMPPQPPSPTPPASGPHRYLAMPPQPPSPTPPASGPHRYVAMPPQPPSPTPPASGPHRSNHTVVAQEQQGGGVACLEENVAHPAQCVVLDEFLSPAEFEELLADTLRREAEFEISEVVAPGVSGSSIDFEYRRSRVLMDMGKHYQIIVDRLKSCLPRVLSRLGCEPFPLSHIEAQITASNHGDFFHWHVDNAHDEISSRQVTFVYFFHREPKPFTGGELRIYDSHWENGGMRPLENYWAIVPQQNKLALFVSSLAHEITPVNCPSKQFMDSRFTVNGWFHR